MALKDGITHRSLQVYETQHSVPSNEPEVLSKWQNVHYDVYDISMQYERVKLLISVP